jgi:hypothetical protein
MSPLPNDGEIINAIGQKVIRWVIKKAHPLSPGSVVVRMYRKPDGVMIYSVTADGKNGVVNFLPREQVLMTEEVMSPQVLLDELDSQERDLVKALEDDEDDNPEHQGSGESPEPPSSVDGQAPS